MIKIKKIKLLFVVIVLSNILFADDFDVDNLLNDIEKKTDLSQKTKLENGGISFIYTRDDMNRMQIKNLKDILKSVYPIGYNENKYGLPDPFSYGSNHPFVSSQIKIFIDNQELTSGLYGSGLVVMGDIDIEWVDHIEIYTQSPTYEFATESTITLIKLYTKSAVKDEGGKFTMSSGSYGASNINGYYAQELQQWSYFAFVAKDNNKRKKYISNDTEISRDTETLMTVATLHKDNNNILLTALDQKRDGFLDLSMDGTPQTSTIDASHIHIGYDTKIDNFSYLVSYDYMKSVAKMTDDVVPIVTAPYYGMFPLSLNESDTISKVFTGEIKYNLKTKKNNFLTGLKYRSKKYSFPKAAFNGIPLPDSNNDTQDIITYFIENQYSLQENSIITSGIQYSNVKNNYSIQNDKMLMYRLGYTFTNDKFVCKTIGAHTETTLEPYLINSTSFLENTNTYYNPQEFDTLVENIIYTNKNNKYELILDYTRVENYLMPNNQGKLESYSEDITMKGIDTRWTYDYNNYDTLFVDLGYRTVDNLPMIDQYKIKTITLRNINTYKKFDIFNELLYSKDNISKKDFYDYSFGLQYHHSKDLTISLKGTNVFDKAKTTSYERVDPITFIRETPLEISPIDKKVMFTMEYLF